MQPIGRLMLAFTAMILAIHPAHFNDVMRTMAEHGVTPSYRDGLTMSLPNADAMMLRLVSDLKALTMVQTH